MSDANLVAAYKIVKAHEDEEKIYYDLDFILSPISKIGKEHSEVFYEAEDSSFSIAKSDLENSEEIYRVICEFGLKLNSMCEFLTKQTGVSIGRTSVASWIHDPYTDGLDGLPGAVTSSWWPPADDLSTRLHPEYVQQVVDRLTEKGIIPVEEIKNLRPSEIIGYLIDAKNYSYWNLQILALI